MAVYKCTICGYVFDESIEGATFDSLESCPRCKQPAECFQKLPQTEEEAATEKTIPTVSQSDPKEALRLEYDKNLVR